MTEPDEKAELWGACRRCSGCNGYARWNKALGAWEPCECRDEDEDGEEDSD
jgi:hypothetical protein